MCGTRNNSQASLYSTFNCCARQVLVVPISKALTRTCGVNLTSSGRSASLSLALLHVTTGAKSHSLLYLTASRRFLTFPIPISTMFVHKPQDEAGLESYRDDPTMTSPQYDDTGSPALHSSPIRDTAADTGRPPLLSIRSKVPLIPTPGTVSKRHPTYVRYFIFFRSNSKSADLSIFAQELLTLRFWFVSLGCVFLGAVGIGLEIAAAVSRDNNGVSPSLFDSWPCADPIYNARLPRRPEKCVLLCFGSILNCER